VGQQSPAFFERRCVEQDDLVGRGHYDQAAVWADL
jgi:hypothetical protein